MDLMNMKEVSNSNNQHNQKEIPNTNYVTMYLQTFIIDSRHYIYAENTIKSSTHFLVRIKVYVQ